MIHILFFSDDVGVDYSACIRKQRGFAAPYIEFGPVFGHLLMEHASVLCTGYLG